MTGTLSLQLSVKRITGEVFRFVSWHTPLDIGCMMELYRKFCSSCDGVLYVFLAVQFSARSCMSNVRCRFEPRSCGKLPI